MMVLETAIRFLKAGGREAEFDAGQATVRLIRRGRWVKVSVSALAPGAVLHRESTGKPMHSKVILEWLREEMVPPGDVISITRHGATQVGTARNVAATWGEDDLQLAYDYLTRLV